jgi:hypothetical protein
MPRVTKILFFFKALLLRSFIRAHRPPLVFGRKESVLIRGYQAHASLIASFIEDDSII